MSNENSDTKHIFLNIHMENMNNEPEINPESDSLCEPDPSLTNMNFVDKMTLECLLNKEKYHKYLAKVDPNTHKEYIEYRNQLQKWRRNILDITKKMLDNPKTQLNHSIESAFEQYTKHCIKYLDNCANDDEEEDETMLFGSVDS